MVESTETTTRPQERTSVTGTVPNAPSSTTATQTEQLVITRNAGGEILKIEKVDQRGSRTDVSEEECASIVGEDEFEELGDALDNAFELGIVEALGGEVAAETSDDADNDLVLERLIALKLLGRRFGRSVRALRRDMVRRLLLRRLVRRHILRSRKERITG